jgi:hypothetical protein
MMKCLKGNEGKRSDVQCSQMRYSLLWNVCSIYVYLSMSVTLQYECYCTV